jgi:hypothetical protein
MSIIDPQLVNIEIAPLPGDRKSGIRLNNRGQRYNLVQAFASHKLERAEQQLQQLIERSSDAAKKITPDRYLLVREVGYYSLWELDRSTLNPPNQHQQSESNLAVTLELQQASIWLFQELWAQWQDLLGAGQLQVFTDNLLAITPQLKSWVDLDRLLILDPLSTDKLGAWAESDFITFDRQLYHLTQKKIGQQFGAKLTIDIIQAMPDKLRSTLLNILEI